jgi:hypothetical protein
VLRRIAIAAAALIVLLGGTLYVAHRVADGPMGPISGASLRAGELVTDPNVDWDAALASRPDEGRGGIELELVATGESRTTGAFTHDGQLYVPCDLGFLWRRAPNAEFRLIGGLLYAVKHWHEDAVRDGRVVLRIAGKRYERQAVRVTDPGQLATLRAITDEKAQKFFPKPLLPVPGDPEAIWFFRMDPR